MFFTFLHVNLVLEGEVYVVKPLHRPDTRTELSSLVSSSTWYLGFDIFYLERTRASIEYEQEEDSSNEENWEDGFIHTSIFSFSSAALDLGSPFQVSCVRVSPPSVPNFFTWVVEMSKEDYLETSNCYNDAFPIELKALDTLGLPAGSDGCNDDVKNILEAARRANEKFEGMESENRNSPPSTHSHSDPSRNDTLSHAPGPFLFLSALPSTADANPNASSPVLPLTLSASTMASTFSPDVLILALAA
ncbi:hypothetical protein EV359DRAFT_80823 [Lentinula novae-zelandiae]|nr:hypothetical protein EV359DRAFT_80823 [Lentinula novae-zelandiae]